MCALSEGLEVARKFLPDHRWTAGRERARAIRRAAGLCGGDDGGWGPELHPGAAQGGTGQLAEAGVGGKARKVPWRGQRGGSADHGIGVFRTTAQK